VCMGVWFVKGVWVCVSGVYGCVWCVCEGMYAMSLSYWVRKS